MAVLFERGATLMPMRKEVRLLHAKAVEALILSVDHFNSPWDRGRSDAVLIHLDHAFEMLLKAGILHRGGRIRERRAKQTIGFDSCVRKALSDDEVRFLTEEQALTLQTINALRDAAQHYLVEISEQQLYMHAQAGVTLFPDIEKEVFDVDFSTELPERVLPVSTNPPRDLDLLIRNEIEQIIPLLEPGRRKRVEARSRLRSLAIMEGSVQGERRQPGKGELDRMLDDVASGKDWPQIFPGVAALRLDTEGEGIPFSLRFVKSDDAVPIRTVNVDENPDAAVVAIKRVNELDYYNLGLNQLAAHVGLTAPRALAVVRELELQENDDYFKEIRIGGTRHKRYSQKAIDRVKQAVEELDMEDVWARNRPGA